VKRSQKGTPRHINITGDAFEAALFENKIPKAKFNRIAVDNRVGSAITRKTEKLAINPTYLKMKVENDMVTVTPFLTETGYL